MKQRSVVSLFLALLLPLLAAAIGGLATARSVSTWYGTLKKPPWNPPAALFGPVWTLLYLLMGVASWLVWRQQPTQPCQTRAALAWYIAQLGLNTLWSMLFFGLRLPGAALLEIIALWGAIAVTIARFARLSPLAAALLIPYQLWVSFAAALNAALWRLNREAIR